MRSCSERQNPQNHRVEKHIRDQTNDHAPLNYPIVGVNLLTHGPCRNASPYRLGSHPRHQHAGERGKLAAGGGCETSTCQEAPAKQQDFLEAALGPLDSFKAAMLWIHKRKPSDFKLPPTWPSQLRKSEKKFHIQQQLTNSGRGKGRNERMGSVQGKWRTLWSEKHLSRGTPSWSAFFPPFVLGVF